MLNKRRTAEFKGRETAYMCSITCKTVLLVVLRTKNVPLVWLAKCLTTSTVLNGRRSPLEGSRASWAYTLLVFDILLCGILLLFHRFYCHGCFHFFLLFYLKSTKKAGCNGISHWHVSEQNCTWWYWACKISYTCIVITLAFVFFLFKLGVPISGFQVEPVGGVILNLLDDVSSWEPGDRIVVASTDYSMYQTEEFTLLPCPECTKHQVKVKGMAKVALWRVVWKSCL